MEDARSHFQIELDCKKEKRHLNYHFDGLMMVMLDNAYSLLREKSVERS